MKEKDRCIIFLEQNGWRCDTDDSSEDYTTYFKTNHYGVDFDNDKMVFICDSGDFLHLPISYYALIGVLMEYRQITCGYTSIK